MKAQAGFIQALQIKAWNPRQIHNERFSDKF
jgi:hypothetical protein